MTAAPERILLSAIRHPDGTITDPTGKVWQVVPREPAAAMALAGRRACCSVADRMETAKQVAVSTIDFWQRVGYQPANEIYAAMLAASRPQVEAVTVPPRQEYPGGEITPRRDAEIASWNACLDKLMEGLK